MARTSLNRIAWWTLTLLLTGIFIAALVPRYQELSQACDAEHHHRDCGFYVLTSTQAEDLTELGISLNLYAAGALFFETLPALIYLLLGIFIMRRRHGDPVALTMSLAIIAIGLAILPEVIPALERAYPATDGLLAVVFAFALLGFVHVLSTFPNGQYNPRWILWNAIALYLGMVGLVGIDLFFPGLESEGFVFDLNDLVIPLLLLVTLAGQIYRYRDIYTREERQQAKWVLFGLAGVIVTRLGWAFLFDEEHISSATTRLWFYLTLLPLHALLVPLFPLTVALAMLRYRLYEVDVVFNRTLVYSALTVTVALFYGLVVIGGGSLLQSVTGQSTPILIALSTLLVAAAFRPLRERLQHFVDRRFYRQKYDAEQAIQRFSASARSAVNLEQLTDELTHVVARTMQPEHVTLWLPESNQDEETPSD